MPETHRRPFLVAQPGPDEVSALRLAAHYLRRVGTQTATEMLDLQIVASDTPLRLTIRDNLFAAADLCESLLDWHESDQQSS